MLTKCRPAHKMALSESKDSDESAKICNPTRDFASHIHKVKIKRKAQNKIKTSCRT